MKKNFLLLFVIVPFWLMAQGNLNLTALPLQIQFNEGNAPIYTFSGNISSIISRNPGVVSWTISGSTVTFSGIKAGRTGLKIESGGQSYYMGLRVNHSDGSLPGLPDYLSVGSVSEDLAGDLAFWKDLDTDATNKSMDIRYIYINGGAIGGWQSWGPQRPATFARESLRLGLIPFFVYYNIPDNGESYQLDLAHAQDPVYMTAYFQDLSNFMDSVQSVMNGELYGIILEPDFLGYMQQNAVPNTPILIPTAVSQSNIATGAGNISTLVHRINNTVATKRNAGHNLFFGWQLNLWAYGQHAGSKGIIRKSDDLNFEPAKFLIGLTAQEITQYGIDAGILSYGADFISIDKYGLDAMGQNNTPNPADCTWFFNVDHWNNYLHFVENMHKTAQKPIILWQIPVGRINESLYASAYNNQTYPNVDNTPTKYEDSSTDFFLGDSFLPMDPNRINYFMDNKWNDPKLYYAWGSGILHWENHMEATQKKGVISVLFGAGVNASTDGVGSPPSDEYFWIQKVQDYYMNGTAPLGATYGEGPLNPCANGCSPEIQFISPVNGGKIVRSELDSAILKFWVNDNDGYITSISLKIDGQSIPTPNLNDLQVIYWVPPTSFGFHTLSVTAMDNSGNSSTEDLLFEMIDFDASDCGYPEWDSVQIYNTSGNIVSYNGLIFRNKWYTLNEMPYLGGYNSPWELEGVCDILLDTVTTDLPQNPEMFPDFQVVPNPAKGGFYIWVNPLKPHTTAFTLYDFTGKKIGTQTLFPNENGVYWNTELLPKGIYFMEAVSENFFTRKKIVLY